MFELAELKLCLNENWLRSGHEKVERNILLHRLRLPLEELSSEELRKLSWFSQAVMAGASGWNDIRSEAGRDVCQIAADIEAGFSNFHEETGLAHLSLLKAVLLYELAGLSGASATYATRNGFDQRFRDFFTRSVSSLWGNITPENEIGAKLRGASATSASETMERLLDRALGEIAEETAAELQRAEKLSTSELLKQLGRFAGEYGLGLTGDDFHALAQLVDLRHANSTARVLGQTSDIDRADLGRLALPVELWPAQLEALRKGLLDGGIESVTAHPREREQSRG